MASTKPLTIDSLLGDISAVPSLPQLYTKLDETINHPRSSIADIAKVLSEDQGLAARILKLANSPLFGYFSRIDTITQAVTIIGIQQVRDLALAISVMGLFKNVPEDLVSMNRFWQHSIGCALASRALASSLRETNLERFFVAGILHDIGRMVMLTKAPEQSEKIFASAAETNKPVCLIEREMLGYDHAAVGSSLIQLWQLPKSFEEIIMYHHSPTQATLYSLETSVIHIADAIVHAMELGNSGEHCVPPIAEEAWENTGLSVDLLPYIMDMVDKQFTDAVNGFIVH